VLTLEHHPASSLVMSLVLHVLLLLAIGWLASRTDKGAGQPPDRPAGIAVVHRMPDRDRYVDAAESASASELESVPETADRPATSPETTSPPKDLTPPIDLAGILKAIESTPLPAAGSGLAGEAKLEGNAFGGAPGKRDSDADDEATAVLFGVSGSGSRFVYVLDRSDSMNGYNGRPLRAAKAELIRSLRSLSDRQRFQIIFYNDKPAPFRPAGAPMQMIVGESSMVSAAERYVRSVNAFGGTEHDAALRLALRMRPDVIFFLTDARIPRLSAGQLFEIRRRAEQSGTMIHAIEFGPERLPPGDSFLRELAEQNGGQYQYISVDALGPPRGGNATPEDAS
jgi:hypothetical protein